MGTVPQMCDGAFGPGGGSTTSRPESAKSFPQALRHSAFADVFRPPGPRRAENFEKQDSPMIEEGRRPKISKCWALSGKFRIPFSHLGQTTISRL